MIASVSCFVGHTIFVESCKCCRSFQKDWYNALEVLGFKDIECGDKMAVNESSEEIIARHRDFQSQIAFDAKVNYYQWARSKASEGRFANKRDFLTWEYHSEGINQRYIAEQIGVNQSIVSRRLKKIEQYLTIDSASHYVHQMSFLSI